MSKLWPFIPTSIEESLQFKTDVRMARSGEIRDSLKDATQILTLNYTAQDKLAARIEGLFRTNISGRWYVPLWQDMSVTTSAISAGATSVDVEEPADFRVGGRAAIIRDDQLAEIINVGSVASEVLDLAGSETVSNSYPAKSIVVPLVTALCPQGLQRSIKFAVTDLSLSFISIEPVDLSEDLLPSYDGYPVLDDPSVLLSDLAGSLTQQMDFIDNGFGSFKLETDETYSRWRGSVGFADYTRQERWERRQFLHLVRGKDSPFLLPTWKNDLDIRSQASPSSSQLVIQRLSDTASNLAGRYIQIDTGSGFIYRKVNSASVGSSTITLTLNATHGQTVTTDMVGSFMHLVRFDQDSFDIEHMRTVDGFFSNFSASVVEVPE